ncbi:MAG: undecaprenyl-diphosphatase UppP [Patescibacteria group bacterium]
MDTLYAIILGIVQGLTEFWPVSSSGHLVVAHEVLNFSFADDLGFDVALHLGTLLALIVFFWRDIVAYIVAFFRSFANWNLKGDLAQRFAWYIAAGTVPAAVAGYFLTDAAETVFRSPVLVACLLIGVGILFIVFERVFRVRRSLNELGWSSVMVIAFAQVFALIPGVSRSGSTILAGLSQGLSRAAAARFSFLLSIPIVFAAGLKKMFDVYGSGISGQEWATMLIGCIGAAVTGYVAITVLLKYLERHPLHVFAYYRFVLGAAILVYWFVQR